MVDRRQVATLGFSAILLALTGCHAGTSGGANRPASPPAAKQEIAVTKILAQHNRNAAAIRSIKATPTIHFVGGGRSAKVDGKLAMERPKDFRLVLTSFGNKKADIGSNPEGFWFWVEDDADKKIYTCDHDQVNSSPLTLTLQPDWIVESMGLREFPADEIQTINTKPDAQPGRIVLTQFRKAKGQQFTKETVVDEATGQIREHRLWAGAKEELLASAVITSYATIRMAEPSAADPDDPDHAASATTTVQVPSRFRLTWVKEKFGIDIIMNDAQINPQFPPAQRTALFTEPKIPGVARQDLAALGNGVPSSRMYESSPRSGIRLGQPEPAPIDVEGSLNRPSADPRPLASSNVVRRSTAPPASGGSSGIVRAPVPTAADPDTQRTGGSNLLNAPPRDQ